MPVRLSDGRELPSEVTVWTTGFGVPDLAARSGLSTDAFGSLLTDETLTSVDDVRIVAAGDSAAPWDLPVRMSCQAAVQLGPQPPRQCSPARGRAARAHRRRVRQSVHRLGRRAGVLQLTGRDDTAKGFYLGGRPGAKMPSWLQGHPLATGVRGTQARCTHLVGQGRRAPTTVAAGRREAPATERTA